MMITGITRVRNEALIIEDIRSPVLISQVPLKFHSRSIFGTFSGPRDVKQGADKTPESKLQRGFEWS